MNAYERLPAEELPTGTFGGARPEETGGSVGTEAAARHLAALAAAVSNGRPRCAEPRRAR